jgi:hypothetical protein
MHRVTEEHGLIESANGSIAKDAESLRSTRGRHVGLDKMCLLMEVAIQDRAYPQPLVTLDLHNVASMPSDRPQHLALQNKDTSQRIQTE